jgi:hypothetical protein
MPLPDFLIIGAMKCGTSTLQAQLAAQPGIFMTTPKEPNFFSDDAIFARGLGWYEGLFAAAPPGALKGEASTHYTKLSTHPQTLPRLAQAIERPKLIYLIRNPVARAVSHYIHAWTLGEMAGEIAAAVEAHPELVDYGCYGRQIAPWVERFGAGSLFLTSLETMNRDPQALLDRVGAFLGHPGPLVWREEQARVNASAERIRRLPLHALLVESPVATRLRRALVPQKLRDRIRASRQMQHRPDLPEDLTRRLQQIFAADHARLVTMFPGNDDIAAAYPFLAR